MVLRQHYLAGGENLINEWHLQFLVQKEAAEEHPDAARPPGGVLQNIRNILDPTSQVRQRQLRLKSYSQQHGTSVILVTPLVFSSTLAYHGLRIPSPGCKLSSC